MPSVASFLPSCRKRARSPDATWRRKCKFSQPLSWERCVSYCCTWLSCCFHIDQDQDGWGGGASCNIDDAILNAYVDARGRTTHPQPACSIHLVGMMCSMLKMVNAQYAQCVMANAPHSHYRCLVCLRYLSVRTAVLVIRAVDPRIIRERVREREAKIAAKENKVRQTDLMRCDLRTMTGRCGLLLIGTTPLLCRLR